MVSLPRLIQGLILFSTLLGVVFLWEVYPLLTSGGFVFVTLGWVLFAVDSLLTFVRPTASFALGLILAVIAFAETLSQPAHFSLVSSGNVLATVTIVLGSAAQVLLIISAAYYFLARRKKDPWAWPGSGP